MKKRILTTIVAIISVTTMFAQATPDTPETPKTATETSTSTTTSYSYSNDNNTIKTGNSSVSIVKTDDIYKLKASFGSKKTREVRELLIDKIGRRNLEVTGGNYLWLQKNDGEKIFSCKLSSGRLKIYVDKEIVSADFYKKVEEAGNEIRSLISDSK